MKRTRRPSQRLVRWTSLCVCFALILSCLAIVPFASVTGKSRSGRGSSPTVRKGSQSGNPGSGQGRRIAAPTPQPGPPAAGLPNLDDLRRAADDSRRHGPREVHAPAPIPSTQRRWQRERERAASTVTTTRIEAKAHHARGTSPTVREGFERASRAMRAGMPALLPQGTSDMATARIDPRNRTGTGGVDVLSNNFNWSLGLVGLRGRAGLDLGLTLSYNSLAWTRSGNYIKYDLDDSTIAPGFRLDFPIIEGPYWNDQASTNFYLMVMPSGARVELRYTGNANTYESQDSAHLQLQVIDSTHILVRPTDGTRMSFNSNNGLWRCNEIKDRNGNYLTITHNNAGDLSSVTDTLGRVVNVTYDGNGNIQAIDQTWNGQTPPHHWATFGWGSANIGNNFSGLSKSGPNNTSIPVLTQVGLPWKTRGVRPAICCFYD
jgi:YD repeat-containing protein